MIKILLMFVKQINKICNDQDFWFQRILIKFPYLSSEIIKKYKGNKTWSQYYIDDLRKINNENADIYLKHGSFLNERLDYVIISLKKGANIHDDNDYAIIA